MSEQGNLQVVQKLYSDFGSGDVPSVLYALTEDVEWKVSGPSDVPFAGEYRGLGEVAGFFKDLVETVAFDQFEPVEYFANDDKVVVLGHERGRVIATGRAYTSDWAMVFTMQAGKIAKFCSFDDAGILKALRNG